MAVARHVTGMDIGKALGEALGLPGETFFVQLTTSYDAAVEVQVLYHPAAEAIENVKALLQTYRLVLTDESPAPDPDKEETLRWVHSLKRVQQVLSARLGPDAPPTDVQEALAEVLHSSAFRHIVSAGTEALSLREFRHIDTAGAEDA